MSSDGPYARSTPGGSTNNNPYGQSYSAPAAGAPAAGGYGGYGGGGSGYGSGPAPGYGASYPAPRYNGAPADVQLSQNNPSDDGSGKGKKPSIALQSLNKNVLIWAGFFTVSLFVYFLLSGKDFSFLMTYGAMSRMFGFGILNVKTWKSQRATGVSMKTLQLYCIVFFVRLTSIVRHEGYLPYDKSGDWLYHFIEIMSLIFCASALYAVMVPFKDTYQHDCDRFGEVNVPEGFGAVYVAVPVLILAIILHPNLNSDFFSDVAWTYAMYLESFAMIPQLYMFQKQANGVVELLTAHFVAALGFGRMLEFVFWIYSYHELVTLSRSKGPGYMTLFFTVCAVGAYGRLFLVLYYCGEKCHTTCSSIKRWW